MRMGDSLAEHFPQIASELDPEANGGITPDEIHKGSGKTLHWKCSYNHRFSQRVVDRTGRGHSCPVCSGHKVWSGKTDLETKFPEVAKWWDYDRNEVEPSHVMPSSNKRFWWNCPDGHSFDLPANKMTSRFSCPVCSGKRIIAGINDLATTHPKLASELNEENTTLATQISPFSHKKVSWKCEKGHVFAQRIESRTRLGQGCPYCAGQKAIVGINDLLTVSPTIAAEWDHQRNGPSRPQDFMAGSNFRAWWVCRRGHNWQATVSNRTGLLTGCPYCSGRRVISGETDFATKHPNLVDEWDFGRNTKEPSVVHASSHYNAWWLCRQENHSYRAPLYARAAGNGCPVCAGKKVQAGFNDVLTTNPEVLHWWHPDRNAKSPESFSRGSGARVWWKCPEGHEFQASVANMAPNPRCAGCAEYGFNPEKDGYLYLLRQDTLGYQQIGITNEPKARVELHRSRGWTVLDVQGPLDGYIVREVEESLKKFLLEVAGRFTRSNNQGKFDGFTESWPESNRSYGTLRQLMADLRDWEAGPR